jgi:hypothetical protein
MLQKMYFLVGVHLHVWGKLSLPETKEPMPLTLFILARAASMKTLTFFINWIPISRFSSSNPRRMGESSYGPVKWVAYSIAKRFSSISSHPIPIAQETTSLSIWSVSSFFSIFQMSKISK